KRARTTAFVPRPPAAKMPPGLAGGSFTISLDNRQEIRRDAAGIFPAEVHHRPLDGAPAATEGGEVRAPPGQAGGHPATLLLFSRWKVTLPRGELGGIPSE